MTKVDWKSAYRRIHLRPSTAVKSCTCIDGLLLMALRMTFGGAPNPAQWSDIYEVVTDLANDIVRRNDWDPTRFKSPHQALQTTTEERSDLTNHSRNPSSSPWTNQRTT